MKRILISKFEYENLEEFAVAFGGTRKVPYFAIYVMELDCEGCKKYIVASAVDEVTAMSWRPLSPKEVSVEVVLPDGRRKAFPLPQGSEVITIGEYR